MSVQITWLGHSTVSVRLETGEVILVDPWITGNPAFPAGYELDRVDVLLLTHGHFDHFGDAVSVAKKFKPAVVAIFEIGQFLAKKGIQDVLTINKGGSCMAGPVKVTMTHAIHSSMIEDEGQMIPAGEAAGFCVKLPDGRVFYHSGDTTVFSDMALIQELYEPELVMLPIGDFFTMDPRTAAVACRFLKPKVVLPLHYGTFPILNGTPAQLREALAKQAETHGVDETRGVEVLDVKAGEAFSW